MQNSSGSNKNNQQPNDPSPPTVIQYFATKLRMNQAKSKVPINRSPLKITTKQGHPAIIFKKEEFLGKLADRCRFIFVGKFFNTMQGMEVLRKIFIDQTQLIGGVKIAHFKYRHIYIDLDNELDHITV